MAAHTHSKYTLVILGAGGVGKSWITVQFVHSKFLVRYDPTIEDSYRKQVEVDGVACTVDILDTAGQEEYSALLDQFMKDGQGFLLIYSVTSVSSFEKLNELYQKVKRAPYPDLPIIVLANKCDLVDQREVSKEQGEEWAKQHGARFMEVSAKTNHNINEAFTYMVKEVNSWRTLHADAVQGQKEKKQRRCILF
jgi:small GTP-binding protein